MQYKQGEEPLPGCGEIARLISWIVRVLASFDVVCWRMGGRRRVCLFGLFFFVGIERSCEVARCDVWGDCYLEGQRGLDNGMSFVCRTDIS